MIILIYLLGDGLGQQIGASRGKMISVKDVVQDSSHILGRHTVHILPYGLVKHLCICIIIYISI